MAIWVKVETVEWIRISEGYLFGAVAIIYEIILPYGPARVILSLMVHG